MFLAKWVRYIAATLLGLSATFTTHAADNYPTRPVTLIVPFAAGGGTDGVARIVGTLLEKELGQPVNVVNRAGGNGVVGHAAIAAAPADGYTLGMLTSDITMFHWTRLSPLTTKDFTALSRMNIDPAAIMVRADAPYKKLDDLLKAIKANPGKFKASGTGLGGIWHLAMAGMLKDLGIDPASVPWVPSTGAAQAMNDLVAGGVEFVTCSLPEARALIDAGKARPLVIMSDKPAALYPNVPTLQAAVNSQWTLGTWRGLAAPRNLPADVQTKLSAALKKIYDGKAFQDFMASRGFGVSYADAKTFEQFMQRADSDMGATMKSVGLVK